MGHQSLDQVEPAEKKVQPSSSQFYPERGVGWPSTWGGRGELTEEAQAELAGLEEAKQKAARILQMGQENMAVEQKLEADRQRRLAMQERLVESTVGRVEEMGIFA